MASIDVRVSSDPEGKSSLLQLQLELNFVPHDHEGYLVVLSSCADYFLLYVEADTFVPLADMLHILNPG